MHHHHILRDQMLILNLIVGILSSKVFPKSPFIPARIFTRLQEERHLRLGMRVDIGMLRQVAEERRGPRLLRANNHQLDFSQVFHGIDFPINSPSA